MIRVAIIILLFSASLGYAGQLAITDTGDEVILYTDGTWKYKNEARDNDKIPKNINSFKKPSDSNFLLKSQTNNSAFYVNTKKWDFRKIKNNSEEGEYEFQLKGGDVYAKAITEEIRISIESLLGIALDNALSAAPDAKIVKKEYRSVNGLDVLYLEIMGTAQGIEFTFFGYYYSDNSGTTQLVAFTGSSLTNKYKTEIDNFLNGLAVR